MELTPQSQSAHLTAIIDVWLKSKEDASESERTGATYRGYITTFRAALQTVGLDLDGLPLDRLPSVEEQEQAVTKLFLAAQGWASISARGKVIRGATYNQRLSVLSSFYTFARKRRLLLIDNPIDLLERREVQEYANAQPLSRERVKQVVDAIDRSVLAGKRDYALLLLFLSTGRRASEVLSLQLKHIEPVEDTAILHFEHCKGGKGMYDKLERRVWRALYDYLHNAFMAQLARKADVDSRTVRRIYREPTSEISTVVLDKLATALAVRPSDLIDSSTDQA